jgi:homopolymeric O-antigen transport system permease protein
MTQPLTDVHAAGAAPAPRLPPLEEPVERVLVPAKRRLKLRDVFGETSVIRVLAARDFKVKYKQSMLGPLWLVFQPLALLVAFVVAFRGLGNVQSSNVPYAVFALAGLTVWAFFQAAMTIGVASIITNVAFVRFTPCPRPAFPLAAIIASLPAFAVTAAATVVSAAIAGDLSLRVVLLPFGLAWLLVLTAGVVAIGCSLAVRYRDIISALPFLLSVGVFFAPVGYSLAGLSPLVRKVVELNPLTGIIETFRWMLFSGYHLAALALIAAAVETVALAVVGWLVFARFETTMADEI